MADTGEIRWTAVGALVAIGPDPEHPGDWWVEVWEADDVTLQLGLVGGESAASRAEALDIARRWRRALTIPAD
ncbi:MAG TPA: hypothetical protein VGR20_15205 [Acidimicrobiia bacterium]|nr:hypothetical protein [Acidimicrobiia bacterium]